MRHLIPLFAAAAGLGSLACGAADPAAPASTPARGDRPALPFALDADAERVRGALSVDAQPGGKRFQGVWITPDGGGERLLVSYRKDWIWRPFDGARVVAVGARWEPDPAAQAMGAQHFRVDALWPEGGPNPDTHEWVGPEVTVQGQLASVVGELGTKSAGERWLTLTTRGQTYLLAGDLLPPVEEDRPARVTGRRFEPTRFAARLGGAWLWVRSID